MTIVPRRPLIRYRHGLRSAARGLLPNEAMIMEKEREGRDRRRVDH